VEKDDGTVIMGTDDRKLEEWSISTSLRCINSISVNNEVRCLLTTKREPSFVCGMHNGTIEIRRLHDLCLISSFKLHFSAVTTLCELVDGSFVSGSYGQSLIRWNRKGEFLHTFFWDRTVGFQQAIELNSNVMVDVSEASSGTLRMWNVPSGECIHKYESESNYVGGVVRLSDHRFLTASRDKTIQVWSDQGECITTVPSIESNLSITSMLKLGDSLVIATCRTPSGKPDDVDREPNFVIRKLNPEHLVPAAWLRTGLVKLCCAAIYRKKEMYDMNELSSVLPEELFWLCFGSPPVTPSLLVTPREE